LDTQPKHLRPVYDRIVKSGSTEEVIGMFDSFRKDNPVTPSPTPNRIEPQTKKIDSLLAVPGSTGGPSQGKKKPDENDFESAWSEAISAKKR
jgi:hypothetical protein